MIKNILMNSLTPGYKKDLHNKDNPDGDHSPRARHPGMWSQVGLRKHHYEQS